MEDIAIPLALLAASLTIYYLYTQFLTKNFDFWNSQNVPYVPPRPIFGSAEFSKPLHETETEWYRKYGRIYGRFEGSRPVLSVGDPDVLKRVLVKDFNIFPNRRDMKFHDPIMDNTLFVLEGEAWKRVRNTVTPTFTTSKLKRMMPLMSECTDLLIDGLSECVQKEKSVHCQKYVEGFVLSAIGRCAFGMTINSLKNPNNEFTEKAKKLFSEVLSWRTCITLFFPCLMKLFRIKLLNPETTNFYRKIVIQVLEERKNLHVVKDDFLQMLLDAENAKEDSNNNGQDTVCERPNCNSNGSLISKPKDKGLSHEEMLSQCITFFIAGFDATTSLLSHVFYQLAVHPNYQETLMEEIYNALDNHDGELSYEALSEMKFMDAVLSECQRMCPAMVRNERRAAQDYYIKDQNILLKKGMIVSIPVYAVHHDPEWYPEPHLFKPERFHHPDPNRPQYVHMPFGGGPRICVGMRFVQVQVKLCLAKVLMKFQILPAPTTPSTLEYTESRNILKVNDVEVCLKERSSN
ncbi:hypothetical protein JTE90_012496 [Oedothorax gibbosus]|uniref:Cytochrome P450 n=1 Tax=Oedothorax gibbosus TaxID=931172 RepID=A0AAV6U536_9ARAC|nr:hypothetical protein JTE90_012496 [Oedothorax gibbosus]